MSLLKAWILDVDEGPGGTTIIMDADDEDSDLE